MPSAEIRVETDGEASVLRVQLLGSNVEQCRRDGLLYYRFQPAIAEVNSLSDFGVEAAALLEGRRVVAVRLAWRGKSEADLKAAFATLRERLPDPLREPGTHTGHTNPEMKRIMKSAG